MRLLARLLSFGTAAALVSGALLALPTAVSAQQAPDVAYVSNMSGNVAITRGDSGNAEAAAINAPLMVGDYLSTDGSARSEVQFDSGHVLRVAPNTQVRFDEMDGNGDSVQLASGSVGVGIVRPMGTYEQVETPSVTVRPREMGFYRVDVNSQGVTSITVRSGDAAILLPQGAQQLTPGSTMEVWGDPSNPQYRFVGPVASNSFDQWNVARDDSFQQTAYQDVPSWMPGAYDLSGYGSWQQYPGYGNVWIPNDVAANWTPYSSGRWVWEPYYGWTWVDNDPWGYAPFHYGRWFFDNNANHWAWVPGPAAAPVQTWSPALVAFIGFNSGGFNFGLNLVDNVGWVPLAPSEPIYPWWGNSAYGNYNVAYNAYSPTYYRNARYGGGRALRWVGRANFASGRYTSFQSVPSRYYAHAAIVRRALPIAPETSAMRYSARTTAVHPAQTRTFHAFRTTPHAPATFAQQRKQVVSYQSHVHITATHTAPRPIAAPAQHFTAPQRHTAPAQHAAPQAQHFTAPQRHAAPAQHAAPQAQHFTAPQRHAAPAQHAAPQAQHFTAPQRHAAPAQHAAPQAQHFTAPQRHAAPAQHAAPAAPVRHYTAPVQHAAPQVHHAAPAAPVRHYTAPVHHAAPQVQHVAPAPVQHVAPHYAAPPVQRPAPVRPVPHYAPPAPVQHYAAPVQHAAPAPRVAPVQHAAPAARPAPAHHAPPKQQDQNK
jgi:hypothetical protein